MKVNRAQLLMHDDTTIEKFIRDHGFPNVVLIERLGPRKDANTAEGNGNRIPVRTRLIHQAGLRFPISPMLKEVMARCRLTFMQMSVNVVRTMLAVNALMLKGRAAFQRLGFVTRIQRNMPEKRSHDTCTLTITISDSGNPVRPKRG